MSKSEKSSFFERVQHGLEASIAFSKGELSLKTVELPTPPPQVSAAQVVSLRKRLAMSQAVFAATLNVSTKLVQSWEQGVRQPARGELRLMQVIILQPQILRGILAPTSRAHSC